MLDTILGQKFYKSIPGIKNNPATEPKLRDRVLCVRYWLFLPRPIAAVAKDDAIFNTLQQLAGAIGTAIISTIVAMPQADFPGNLAKATATGSENACLLLCVLVLLLFFLMYRATKNG